MILTVIKHVGAWDTLGNILKVKAATFLKVILTVILIEEDTSHEVLVLDMVSKYKMSYRLSREKISSHFKHCFYKKVVKIQAFNRPSRKIKEVKVFTVVTINCTV